MSEIPFSNRGLEPTIESSASNVTDSGSKRKIQMRLESRKKFMPSSQLLQHKLDSASLRRETALLKSVLKVTNYTDGVKKRANRVSTRKLNDSTALREKIANKQTTTIGNKESAMNGVSTKIREDWDKISRTMEAVVTRRTNEHAALEKMLEVRMAHASENKDALLKEMTANLREKRNKLSSAQIHKLKTVQDLQGKLEDKQARALSKREILLKSVSERAIGKKEQSSTDSEQRRLIELDNKSKQKQILAAENKETLINTRASRIQEKMSKVSNVQVQKAATVEALQEKLEERQTLATTKKENLLKNVSEKFLAQKERYSDATLKKLKAVEIKSNLKQFVAAENKEKHVFSITSKIHEKMEKVSIAQEQKAAIVHEMRDKLEERQARAFIKKENLLRELIENSLVRKERYSEASMQKLKLIETKSNQKQIVAAENKENLVQSVTLKIQSKMNKISKLQVQKTASVDALQDKLEERQALASAKKENLLKDISEKPLVQRERYSKASLQKIIALKDKLNKKHTTAAENKEKLVKNAASKLQEKMEQVSGVQAQKVMTEEAQVAKIREKQAHATTNKRVVVRVEMSHCPVMHGIYCN